MQESPWEQVQREFACTHPKRALVYVVDSLGRRQYRRECSTCGDSGPSVRYATLTAEDIRTAVPRDESIRADWWAARQARAAALADEAREAEAAERRREYSAYMTSFAWKRKAAAVCARDVVCQGCLARPATQAHHLTYVRLGREMLFDLIGVCVECHALIHPGD